MSAPLLALNRLSIRDVSGAALVDNVCLHVQAGETLCIIGETGSGKSLVAQALTGLLPAGLAVSGTIDFGAVRIACADTAALQARWARDIALIPGEPRAALDPLMRIGRQMQMAGASGVDSVARALAQVDLPPPVARAWPFQLSGGMSQRVVTAHALMTGAALVIADEPTKGLDPARIGQVVEFLASIAAQGRTLIVITHDMNVARSLGGRVAVMKSGALVESGAVAEVLAHPAHAYTQALLAADPAHWPACAARQNTGDIVLAGHDLRFAWPGGKELFSGLSLHVRRGAVVALTGPSGSGKTTLGNVLLGLAAPQRGEVSWGLCDPYNDRAGARLLRRRYQKLHQDPASVFAPHRTIGAQIADLDHLGAEINVAANLPPLLERLGLGADLLTRHVSEISGGEAQRLALARLLLLKPDVIVADEPTSRLDPIVQRDTMELLREVAVERGLAILLISHDRALVAAVAGDVVELGGGGSQEKACPRRQILATPAFIP